MNILPVRRLSRKARLYGCPVYEPVPSPPTGRIIFRGRLPGPATRVLGIEPVKTYPPDPGSWPPPIWSLEWDGGQLPEIQDAIGHGGGMGGLVTLDGIPHRIWSQVEIQTTNVRGDWLLMIVVSPEWTRETDAHWRGELGYQLAARAGMSQEDAEAIRDYGSDGRPGRYAR